MTIKTEEIEEEKPKVFDEIIKLKRCRVISSDEESISSDNNRNFKRTVLCVSKPSYLLSLGPKSNRSEYLNRLPKILHELLRLRSWREASSVLSVLMQATMKDLSPKMNRLKYEAHIQILCHLQPNKNLAQEIGRIYDTWIGKIGRQHKEERLLVWFEQICHFIDNGMDTDAYSAVISMMQNRHLGMLPRSNLFIGITFYKMWCRKFLKELQPDDNEGSVENVLSDMSVSRSVSPVRDTSVYSVESSGSVRANESEASVINYKRLSHLSISGSGGTLVDVKVKLESPQHYTNPPRIYATSEENETPLEDVVAFDPALVKILADMDPWLFPFKPPEDPDTYRKMVDDFYYKEAVRYLRITMQSPRHVSLVALHPLVQLLLIGGHADEAMRVVNEICNKVHDIKPFRIKACMMEKFHPNSDMLAKSYEDILKIDPSCVTTLKKLIGMCLEDGYSRESLIEMIALHVEASFPEHEIWKEFAVCLIHFFENLDEDRMSVCIDGSGEGEGKNTQTYYSVRYNPTPRMFTSNTIWTLRAKWWLNRHFSSEILDKEIENREWELMSYKAACASHIYGREFCYVTKVYSLLEKDDTSCELFKFLRTHRRNWNMIYNLDKVHQL